MTLWRLPLALSAAGLLASGGFALSGSAQQPAAAPAPALRNYQPVTAGRLRNPEDHNWLMIRRTYDGWGYSPLQQITAANVKGLRLVWTAPTGDLWSRNGSNL